MTEEIVPVEAQAEEVVEEVAVPVEEVPVEAPAAPRKGKAKKVTVVFEGSGTLLVPDYGNGWGGKTIELVKGVAQEVPLELVKQLEGSVHAGSLTVKE